MLAVVLRRNAMDQLKHWALEKGVTAIADVQCEAPVGMDLDTNCWSRITCSATAIRVNAGAPTAL